MTTSAPARPQAASPAPPAVRRVRVSGLYAAVTVGLVVLAAVDLTQGTSGVGTLDLLKLAVGAGTDRSSAVLVGSRVPRTVAAVFVGLVLGMSGAILQSVARNSLAAPDTLAVNSGAYLGVVATAAFGLSLPVVPAGAVAFVGGLLAAGLVLGLTVGGGASPTRLVLAGSAVALALDAVAYLLLILFEQGTVGLYAYGNGTLVQADTRSVEQMAPVVVVATLGAVLLASRLDLLALGDDTASSLGLDVRRTRAVAVVLAVMLAAAAVTVAGPVAFVGLAAPVIARAAVRRVGRSTRHLAVLPLAGLVGAVIVVGADVALRTVLGAQSGVTIPAGVVTTVVGAVVLVRVAQRHRDTGTAALAERGSAFPPGTLRFAVVTTVLAVLLVTSVVAGVLLGDTMLLWGDVVNWLRGAATRGLSFVLDTRTPRVTAAVLAGAALAAAGTGVQAVCRNPLAEPGLLGITGGAGIGAVWLLVVRPGSGSWALAAVATVGALVAFGLVLALSWRGGLDSDRLVLVGFGFSSGAAAVITFIIVLRAPYDTGLALTWLSGTTYGRTFSSVLPVAAALLVLLPVLWSQRRAMDLVRIDDDLPRTVGVRLRRVRVVVLVAAALLTAASVSAVGVVGFVGLVAPHVARALVGGRTSRVLPVAVLVGALLVSVADTVGRTVIAPAQVPVGLMTAILGAPYFVYLLRRTRPR